MASVAVPKTSAEAQANYESAAAMQARSSRLRPTLVKQGTLSDQCSDIQNFFNLPCVPCPAYIDGTANFCFSAPDPTNGAFGIPFEAVTGITAPVAGVDFVLGVPDNACTAAYTSCHTPPGADPLCLTAHSCLTCCSSPWGSIPQPNVTADEINTTCNGTVNTTDPNNNFVCYPCAEGYYPVQQAGAGTSSMTYYSCAPSVINLSLFCDLSDQYGTSYLYFRHYNLSNTLIDEGGLNYNQSRVVALNTGDWIIMQAQAWTWWSPTDPGVGYDQSYQTCWLTLNFADFSTTTPAVSAQGTPQFNENYGSGGYACAGTVQLLTTDVAVTGSWSACPPPPRHSC